MSVGVIGREFRELLSLKTAAIVCVCVCVQKCVCVCVCV